MDKKKYWVLFVGALFILQGCGINSNLMWKQEKGVAVNSDDIPLYPSEDYRLSIDDKITFSLTTNNGSVIIEEMSGIGEPKVFRTRNIEYIIRRDSTVELPKIGKVSAVGLTIEDFEDTLVSKFSKQYQEPFIQVQVTNQRVIVFPGNGSDATVVPLLNANTSLMEAIAQAGGIADRGKANTVKLMRKVGGERKIFVMDLSVIEGLKYADMIVQANDYIYVEPSPEISREFSEVVVPVVSLISSALIIFSVLNSN